MDSLLSEIDSASPDAAKERRKAIEEYAVECSILKVWGSEMIDYVVDEAMQIFAGYGFVEEYPAERAYRDARINRIFEGTNEINRLIITGFLLKRAMSGQLPLMPAIKKLMDEVLSGPSAGEELEKVFWRKNAKLVAQVKKLGLFIAGAATQKYMDCDSGPARGNGRNRRYDDRNLCDGVGGVAGAKDGQNKRGGSSGAPACNDTGLPDPGVEKIEGAAKKVIADVAEGDMLRTQLAVVRRLSKHEPFNTIALRQQIAQKAIEAGKYTLA